jgi:hypothetical protein
MRRDADADVGVAGILRPQPRDDVEDAVGIVQEAALAVAGLLPAEAAGVVQHRQMGDADAGRLGRFDDPVRQLGAVGIGAAVGLVMQVVELATAV